MQPGWKRLSPRAATWLPPVPTGSPILVQLFLEPGVVAAAQKDLAVLERDTLAHMVRQNRAAARIGDGAGP
ncbi:MULTISPECIES: hypothetical protein [Streptomyces]|uniref:Uncharacterized protein n=1 Tax=Streptomyces qinglanensis TaxID=943816 RepID=A0A1E7K5Z8_9ACTN|nr:hypothetical protein [Streptomyces qinglanensis]OEU99331.1 hypothetical protein AN217_17625 [Streptomyces qinglanensis]OEV28839.1 hypothetical protein AN220_00200 [Streptomyces nanshensis]